MRAYYYYVSQIHASLTLNMHLICTYNSNFSHRAHIWFLLRLLPFLLVSDCVAMQEQQQHKNASEKNRRRKKFNNKQKKESKNESGIRKRACNSGCTRGARTNELTSEYNHNNHYIYIYGCICFIKRRKKNNHI